jgi:hypothetical protein
MHLSKPVAMAGWALAVALSLGLAMQWHRARDAEARLEDAESGCAEVTRLSFAGDALQAEWLARGLEALRSGDADAGYRALDSLLLALVRSAESVHDESVREALDEPRRYLEAVGDPWTR